jgi:hypothetical protein
LFSETIPLCAWYSSGSARERTRFPSLIVNTLSSMMIAHQAWHVASIASAIFAHTLETALKPRSASTTPAASAHYLLRRREEIILLRFTN